MTRIDPPLALLAELTHRCPLHCVYCSNPLELQRRERELSTAAWIEVFQQAAALGARAKAAALERNRSRDLADGGCLRAGEATPRDAVALKTSARERRRRAGS